MSTERDFTNDDTAYRDALARLAKVLVTFSVQSIHELVEEEAGAELLLDLNLAIGDADTEFHDGLAKLARGDMCIEDTTTQDFEAEVFFGAQEAAAGRRALEAAGFDIEPRPDNIAGDGGQTVWMMAYGTCPGDADTPEIIKQLEALIEPHGGMIWELGPAGEPAPPRLYEMAKLDAARKDDRANPT